MSSDDAAGVAGPEDVAELRRLLAAALAGDEVAGEARMRALTGLAGLLGGV